MRLGTALTQVQLFLLVVLNVGQMHRGRVGAELALHASFLPLFCAGDPTTLHPAFPLSPEGRGEQIAPHASSSLRMRSRRRAASSYASLLIACASCLRSCASSDCVWRVW